jgi:sugar (pentulose or hexulose) kinase
VPSDLVLALDAGSQSARALLFDPRGQVLAKAGRPYQPMRHPEEGAVEQEPADIRDCLIASVAACLQQWGGDVSRIAATALTTQRNTQIPCDADGAPLGDGVSWLDRRTAGASSEPSALLRTGLKLLGDRAMIPRLLSKSVARLWRERDPEMLGKVRRIAPLEAWLTHELSGRMAMAPGGMAGVLPSSLRRRSWATSARYCRLLGFEPGWLVDIVEAGQQVGGISAKAAEATGLPEGLPVFACGGDKQAEALGAGVRLGVPGVAAISMGTASSIMFPWPKALESGAYHWVTFCSCEPGSWQMEYMLFRGMWTVAWFARQLGADLAPRAQEEGRAVEALLCEEAEAVPVGSEGVLTWPRWSPTLQDPDETGTVIGLRETHTRAHMFRSLLEGIAFDLKRGLRILEGATGARIHELRVGGGGSRSDLVVRILADVLNLPLLRPPSEELAARGAAMVAAVGGGLHPSMDAAVAAMVPEAPRIEPDPGNVARYARVYDVWARGADETRGLSRALARLRR